MLRETHQDFVVRSSDFKVKKSAWERPLWIFVLHLRTKKRKSWWLVCKTKNLKVKWKLRRRQEAVSLWMMQVLKIANIQFLIFLSRLAFLSSASMKLNENKFLILSTIPALSQERGWRKKRNSSNPLLQNKQGSTRWI